MDLEQKSIERIKTASELSLHHYGKPLVCTYSGGKDSDVMLELFKRSGVPFEAHNSHTTVDSHHTVYHIRNTFKNLEANGIKCEIDYHIQTDRSRITMWNLIPKKKIPPTRTMRYCCSILKETGCKNRFIATGVRWEESTKRRRRSAYEHISSSIDKRICISDEKMLLSDQDPDTRRLFEQCQMKAKTVVNPIIDWSNFDIWEYINSEKIQTNPMYEMGYFRVGCIGCPMAGKHRYKEFSDFPKIKQAYIHAFDRMLQQLTRAKWKSGEDVFRWWMEDDSIEGQMSIEDFIGE